MQNFLIVLLLFSTTLYAGDCRYEWANIGAFGLGDIDNWLIIYYGDSSYITAIPSFVSYWKRYVVGLVMMVVVIVMIKRKKGE